MRKLNWSQDSKGNLNAKVGHITMFTISYYPKRGYFIAPKLPGYNKTIDVKDTREGCIVSARMYQDYLNFLNGGSWR